MDEINGYYKFYQDNFHIFAKSMPSACASLDRIQQESLSTCPHIIFYGSNKSVIYELSSFFAHKIVSRNIGQNISQIDNPHIRRLAEIELSSDKKTQFQYIESKYYVEISLKRYGKYMNHIIDDLIKPRMAVPHIVFLKHVFVFHDIDRITNQCMSRLLRIMEKHSEVIQFIFTTTSLSKIITSFRSRCLHIRVPICDEHEVMQVVRLIPNYFDTSFELSDSLVKEILNMASNSVAVSMSILSCLESGIAIEDIKNVFSDNIVSHMVDDVLLTVLPKDIIQTVRTTYANASLKDYDMSDMCKIVLRTVLSRPKISKNKQHKLINLIADCNHDACMGDRGLFHFEKMMYTIYEILTR